MWWTVFISGLMLGAASSLHCMGMCGPLCLSVPIQSQGIRQRIFTAVFYQLGRISIYVILGLVAGLLGRGFYIAGWQQTLTIVAGGAIIVFAIGHFFRTSISRSPLVQQYYIRVHRFFSRYVYTSAGEVNFYMAGCMNGLLPCGMVYMALIAAMAFQALPSAMLFMFSFGTGTAPALIVVMLAGSRLRRGRSVWLRQLSPMVMILIGAILILRGLNLGIPYLSPGLPLLQQDPVVCHVISIK